MEIWYLLITEKFLFWNFRWWEIRPFFHPKSWWKDDIYLVFLSFPWYSRTWEIWFFAPWLKILSLQIHKCTPFWLFLRCLLNVSVYLFCWLLHKHVDSSCVDQWVSFNGKLWLKTIPADTYLFTVNNRKLEQM